MCICYRIGIYEGVVAVIFFILISVFWDFLIVSGVGVERVWGVGIWGFVYVNV